jgi:outer membrane protein OmpA-like peptidoglycan-associated protein
MKTFHLLFTLILFGYGQSIFAQDVPNSKDFPSISRFPGSTIRFYEYKKFDAYKLRKAAIKKGSPAGEKGFQVLEGSVTRIVYQCPKTTSALEVYRSYETALLKGNFERLFTCQDDGCGNGFGGSYPSDNAPHIRSYEKDQRYFSGRRSESEDLDVYVSLYTVFTQDGPVARLDIVEVKKMEADQVTVSAARIRNDFEKLGKAVINQVYFESGNAVLLPNSTAVIAEIARFLQENPSLKIFVVGHTDNNGGFDFNLTLSQQRADAVVKELTNVHKIQGDRVKPKGLSYLCPVATNESESGKARNRRVELIKQ